MPSLDQLKDKDKFNGSDDPESIPFATFLGLLTARCVQQDIGHVLVDTDPNQRTRRLVIRGSRAPTDACEARNVASEHLERRQATRAATQRSIRLLPPRRASGAACILI